MHNFKLKITNGWFYSPAPFWMRFFLIFINGDIFFLLPVSVILLLLFFIQVKLGLLGVVLYVMVREGAEIIYWFLQQFGTKTYRPYDFGLTKLDNNAIYILYQTFSFSLTVLSSLCFVAILLYFK
jgi:hypothetical protein